MDDQITRNSHDVTDGAASDKLKGHGKEVLGTVKEKVGSALGDRKLQGEGMAQNAEGKKDRLKGEIKDGIKDVKAKVQAAGEVVREKFDEVRSKAR